MNDMPQPRCSFPAKCPHVTYYLESLALAQGARKQNQRLTRSGHRAQTEVGFQRAWCKRHRFLRLQRKHSTWFHITHSLHWHVCCFHSCIHGGFIHQAVFLMCFKLWNYQPWMARYRVPLAWGGTQEPFILISYCQTPPGPENNLSCLEE